MKTIFLYKKSPEQLTPSSPAVNAQATDLKMEPNHQVIHDPLALDLPTFPDSLYATLPQFLQKVVARCSTNEERDMMLLGSVVTLGSCLPKVSGFYAGRRVYPNLFLFITARASAGKGNLALCKQLVGPIHESLRRQTQLATQEYETMRREFNVLRWKEIDRSKPVKPPERMLFIPANNSATGVFQLLYENDGCGLIFETEGDTLSNAFNADNSNYSDGMRKGFHHETISYNRRTGHEYAEIKCPRLSLVLSGTPSQVASLIPGAENGLFSRFLFYHMNMQPVWKDVFAASNHGLEDYFDSLGQEFYSFYKALGHHPDIEFCLSPGQHEQFNAFFSRIQEKYLALQGMDYMATIRRLGLIAFRIAMIFTTLRLLESGNFSPKLECTDSDFQAVLSMVGILVKHSSHVFSELPGEAKQITVKNKKELFLERLPEKFTYQEHIALAKSLSLSGRTAESYISEFCNRGLVLREQKGTYINIALLQDNLRQNQYADNLGDTDA